MIFRAKINLSALAHRLSRSARILLLFAYFITQTGIVIFIPSKTYADEEVGQEVISLRTEASKTISMGKNSKGLDLYQLISFADKVHFQTPNGWQEVDNAIIPEKFEKFSYRNSANDFTFRAGEFLENGVLYSEKGKICEFKLDKIKDVSLNNSNAKIIENKVIYPDIYPNADLEFTVNSTGITTEIVVKEEEALKERISFELVNCQPSSFDQAQMMDDDSGSFIDEEIVTDGAKTILVLAPDYSQLGEIKGDVRIDPSISNSSNSDTFVSPSTLWSGNGSRRFMTIGTYYDSTIGATFRQSRALIHFGILNIPQNSILTSARLQVHHYGTNGNNGKLHISRITSPWDENTVWSGPGFESVYGDLSFPYYNNNFTAQLREIPIVHLNLIENLRLPNYGVMLKNYDDNTPGVVICSRNIPSGPCHSGMEPKIVVNYAVNQAPNPPTLDYPNEGWELGADENYATVECDKTGTGKGCRVTFHVKTEDTDNTFPLETEVEVKRIEGGNANFTYYQSSDGWFSNQIHLSDGRWS